MGRGPGGELGPVGDGDCRGPDDCAADAPPSRFGEGGLSSRPPSIVAYPWTVMARTVGIRRRRGLVKGYKSYQDFPQPQYSKSSESSAESGPPILVVARHTLQQRPHPPSHRLDLARRALYLQHPPHLVDVHLRLRLPLHCDDGRATPADNDPDVVPQLHLRVQDLAATAAERVGAVVVEALPRARPVAGPELRLPVVAAGGEEVTGRVPLHVPYRHVVRERDLDRGFLRSLRPWKKSPHNGKNEKGGCFIPNGERKLRMRAHISHRERIVRIPYDAFHPLSPMFQYIKVPSMPPLANTVSYTGCQAMLVTSL